MYFNEEQGKLICEAVANSKQGNNTSFGFETEHYTFSFTAEFGDYRYRVVPKQPLTKSEAMLVSQAINLEIGKLLQTINLHTEIIGNTIESLREKQEKFLLN